MRTTCIAIGTIAAVGLVAAGITGVGLAQQQGAPQNPPAQKPPAQAGAAQNPAEMPMAKPGPEMEVLKMDEGTWTAAVKMWMEPNGQPMTTGGTEVNKMSLGGFWLVGDVKEEGGPYMAHTISGYDAMKKKYVGIWVDNMSPAVVMMEGSFDKAKKTFTWMGEAPGMDGKMAKKRSVATYPDANTRHVEEFTTGPDGKEFKSLEIDYKRK